MSKMLMLTAMVLSLSGPAAFAADEDWSEYNYYQTDESQDITSDEANAEEEWLSDSPNPRPRPPGRRPPNRRPRPPQRPWYFLGCVNSNFDCSWAATRWGFREYLTQFDIRCRNAFYACYAR
jgi:hypothetical protein